MSHNNRGNALSAKGDYQAAIADYDRALQIIPGSYEALTGRGAAQQQLGNYSAAVVDYTKALEIAPKSVLILTNRASANEEIDKNAAFADYTRIIELQPENAEAYARRGVLLVDLNRKTEAINDLRKAFQLDSGLRTDYSRFLAQAESK